MVLVIIATLVAVSMVPGGGAPQPTHAPGDRFSDITLYRAIVDRVSRGENYYVAAAAEQREHNFPTAPAAVIREPTQTLLLVALRTDMVRHGVLIGLAVGVIAALWFALGRMDLTPFARRWALLLMISGMAVCMAPNAAYMHESWASLLITLSLALRRPGHWALAVCAGLAACLFREVALPFLFVMAAFAVYERRWRESFAWLGAIALFCGLFAIHCALAGAQHQVGDLSSNGWLKFGGIGFVVATSRWNGLFALAPPWVLIALLCVSAAGLAGFRNGLASRAALTLIGYVMAFVVVGRPENDYWGILYAPLIPLGLVLAPTALKDLVARALAKTPWPERSRRAGAFHWLATPADDAGGRP